MPRLAVSTVDDILGSQYGVARENPHEVKKKPISSVVGPTGLVSGWAISHGAMGHEAILG